MLCADDHVQIKDFFCRREIVEIDPELQLNIKLKRDMELLAWATNGTSSPDKRWLHEIMIIPASLFSKTAIEIH